MSRTRTYPDRKPVRNGVSLSAQIHASGFTLGLDDSSGELVITPASRLTEDQIAFIREHKAEIVEELREWTKDAQLPERQWRESTSESNPIIGSMTDDELTRCLVQATAGTGITPKKLCQRLSPEDLEDVRQGQITLDTVRAYAKCWASAMHITTPERAAWSETAHVRCGDCIHFQPDEIGDGTGIGRCGIGAPAAYLPQMKLLYPNIERCCDQFTGHSDERDG